MFMDKKEKYKIWEKITDKTKRRNRKIHNYS